MGRPEPSRRAASPPAGRAGQRGPGTDRTLRITVAIGVENGNLKLSVWNSGEPVPADFNPREQKGMGLRLVSELAWRQHRGSFTVRPHQGGSIAEIVIEDDTLHRE